MLQFGQRKQVGRLSRWRVAAGSCPSSAVRLYFASTGSLYFRPYL